MQSKSSEWFLYEIQENQLAPFTFLLILSLVKSTLTSNGKNLNSTWRKKVGSEINRELCKGFPIFDTLSREESELQREQKGNCLEKKN